MRFCSTPASWSLRLRSHCTPVQLKPFFLLSHTWPILTFYERLNSSNALFFFFFFTNPTQVFFICCTKSDTCPMVSMWPPSERSGHSSSDSSVKWWKYHHQHTVSLLGTFLELPVTCVFQVWWSPHALGKHDDTQRLQLGVEPYNLFAVRQQH